MRQIVYLAFFLGLFAISIPSAAVAAPSAAKHCGHLQDAVNKRRALLEKVKGSKDSDKKAKKIKRAENALALAQTKYSRQCSSPVCAGGKTYPSLAAAKEAGAKLEHYGSC